MRYKLAAVALLISSVANAQETFPSETAPDAQSTDWSKVDLPTAVGKIRMQDVELGQIEQKLKEMGDTISSQKKLIDQLEHLTPIAYIINIPKGVSPTKPENDWCAARGFQGSIVDLPTANGITHAIICVNTALPNYSAPRPTP